MITKGLPETLRKDLFIAETVKWWFEERGSKLPDYFITLNTDLVLGKDRTRQLFPLLSLYQVMVEDEVFIFNRLTIPTESMTLNSFRIYYYSQRFSYLAIDTGQNSENMREAYSGFVAGDKIGTGYKSIWQQKKGHWILQDCKTIWKT